MSLPNTPRKALRQAKTCYVEVMTGIEVFVIKIAKKEALRLYSLAPYSWVVSYNVQDNESFIGPTDETIPDSSLLIFDDGVITVVEEGKPPRPYSEVTTQNIKIEDVIMRSMKS